MISFLFLFFLVSQVSSDFAPSSPPVGFYFSSFNVGSCNNGRLICMGSVTSCDNGYLSLTPELLPTTNSTPPTGVIDQVGRVLYSRPVLAWPAMITTTFTIRITEFPNFPGSGDGMTFVFAPDTSPSSPESYGSALGISTTRGSNTPQVAIELDSYKNDFDIDGNHIGVDIGSVSETVTSQSLNSTGIELKSGRMIKVRINYNGKTNMLYVFMGYYGQPLMKVLEQYIVLSNLIPSSVYVGFTASTGAFAESHQILDWRFASWSI